MLKNLILALTGAVLAVGVAYATQNNTKATLPSRGIPATSGKQMFASYCAPCHGVDGKGHGPVAAVLKTQPADLTVLSRNNNGKFPSAHVKAVLDYGTELPAHGSHDMPIWGPLFGKMDQAMPPQRALRISNLSRYLEGIQVK